jgi:UDP-glucose 4-epimerase
VFGKRQSKEYAGVIKLFLEKIKQKMPPKINGDGLQTRDFVYIDDVVRANISAMDSNIKHEFFNVGTENSISILDLANVVINASGLSLEPIHGPELSGDVRSTRADITLIRKLLNWEPKIRLDDWLTKIISNKDFQDI